LLWQEAQERKARRGVVEGGEGEEGEGDVQVVLGASGGGCEEDGG